MPELIFMNSLILLAKTLSNKIFVVTCSKSALLIKLILNDFKVNCWNVFVEDDS